MSIIVLVAIMCKNVVNGAIAEGGWMTYCQDKTKAPEGALFACFRSNDGGIHYNGRDLTSSVIYSNPSKANGMFDTHQIGLHYSLEKSHTDANLCSM